MLSTNIGVKPACSSQTNRAGLAPSLFKVNGLKSWKLTRVCESFMISLKTWSHCTFHLSRSLLGHIQKLFSCPLWSFFPNVSPDFVIFWANCAKGILVRPRFRSVNKAKLNMALALNFVHNHVKAPHKSWRAIFLVSALLFYSIFILSGSLAISKSEIHELEKDCKREWEVKRERK